MQNSDELQHQPTAGPVQGDVFTRPMSRHDFIRHAFQFGAVLLAADMLVACGDTTFNYNDLKPQTAGERAMMPVLYAYSHAKQENGDLSDSEAALVSQASILSNKPVHNSIAVLNIFENNTNATPDEAAFLTVAAAGRSNDTSFLIQQFDQARSALPDHEGQAVNVVAVAQSTGQSLEKVAKQFQRSLNTEHDDKVVPIIVSDELLNGNTDESQSKINDLKRSGLDSESDINACLYATVLIGTSSYAAVTITKELKRLGVNEAARADLIVATALNHTDLETIVEMYNYAGALQGVDEEAAAKLVLAATGAKVAEFADPNSDHTATGNFAARYYYYRWFYGGYHYTSYPRTETTFSPIDGPSFSEPGKSPVRGTSGGRFGKSGSARGGGFFGGEGEGHGGASGEGHGGVGGHGGGEG